MIYYDSLCDNLVLVIAVNWERYYSYGGINYRMSADSPQQQRAFIYLGEL